METIYISCFRCFEYLHVELNPGINLFIGDNASGKTSLLMACKYAVNCFFSGFSDKYTNWKVPVSDDFYRRTFAEKRFVTPPIEISFNYYKEEFDWEDTDLFTQPVTLFRKDEKSRPRRSSMRTLISLGKKLLEEYSLTALENNEYRQPHALPLIASFSTHGIHKSPKINSGYFIEYAQTPSFGYYLCGDTDGLLSHWVRRMLVLTEADVNPLERVVVLDSLHRMFGPEGCDIMSGFDVRINFKDIFCIYKDGRYVPVSMLSDGYKRLFSIVIDIAFRCALLNSGIYGEKAALETKGTVIIDEIDLHLHPTLQTVVLKALQHTFPKLQFIVSTHAPMVMSGVESNGRNQVKYMRFDKENGKYTIEPVDTYGMDLSTIAETVLNVPKRDIGVERRLRELENLIDEENYKDAKALLADLRTIFGERLPELSGFETQIFLNEEVDYDQD